MAVYTTITNQVPEEGSIGYAVAFTDEEGTALVPDSITWTLTDQVGNVINSRSAEVVTPASSVTIVLSGDDLTIGNYGTRRVLLVEYVYTSTLGTSLPDKHEVHFQITNFVAVP